MWLFDWANFLSDSFLFNDSGRAFFMHLSRGCDQSGVVSHHRFVLNWIDLLECSQVSDLIDVPNLIKLTSELLFVLVWQPHEFSSAGPVVELQLYVLPVSCFSLLRQAKHLDRIPNQISLYLLIDWRIGTETWTVVDFEQIWFTLVVQHDVKAQYVEAHRVLVVI